jgi:hypothetical protein
MGLRKLWYVTSVFFLVFTFVLSLWFDLQTFVAYRSSQGLILTHIAVTIAITQLGRESVCCISQLRSQLRNWEERVFVAYCSQYAWF